MFNIYINDGEVQPPDDETYYIVAKDGIYLHKKLDIIESCIKVNKISFIEPINQYVKLNIPKIPRELTRQIYTFFLEVYDRFKTESVIMIFYNKDTKEYKLRVPTQSVSSAHLTASYDITIPGFLSIGTCHSHAGFGAFHSSTDIDDEKDFDGIHITFGDLNKDKTSISIEIVSNGFRSKCNPTDYLEGIVEDGEHYRLDLSVFPEEWMGNVEIEKFVASHGYNWEANEIDPLHWRKSIIASNPIWRKPRIASNHTELPCENCPFKSGVYVKHETYDDMPISEISDEWADDLSECDIMFEVGDEI